MEFFNRLFVAVTELHPTHPLIVHFPIALTSAGFLFILFAFWQRNALLEQATFANIILASISTITGIPAFFNTNKRFFYMASYGVSFAIALTLAFLGGDRIEKGLILRTFADIMNGSENGPVVTPSDAENSLTAKLVASQKMPKRIPKLTPPQVQILIDWINQGALDN